MRRKSCDDSKFCISCGAPINREEAPKNPPTETPAPAQSPDSPPAGSFAPTQTTVQAPVNNYTYAQAPSYAPAMAGYPMQQAKPKKHFPLWAILTICISAVIIIAIILFFIIASGASKPEKTVEKYFNAITSQDYAGAYDVLNYENKDFTSKDAYIAFMKQQDESKSSSQKKATVTQYKITDSSTLDDAIDSYISKYTKSSSASVSSDKAANTDTKTYYVTYKLSNSTSTKSMTITLEKQPSKQFLFFDSYKVDGSVNLASDCTVTVPVSSKVTIDGKEFPETSLVKDDSSTDSAYIKYQLPTVLKGSHKFKITAPYMKDIEQTQSISSGGSYSFTNFTFNDEVKTTIQKKSKEIIPKFFEFIAAQKPFEEFQQYCSSDESTISSLKSYYEYIEDAWKTSNITGITMNSLEQSSSGNYSNSSQIAYYDKYIASYKVTYADSEQDIYGNIELVYIYENNDWKVMEVY